MRGSLRGRGAATLSVIAVSTPTIIARRARPRKRFYRNFMALSDEHRRAPAVVEVIARCQQRADDTAHFHYPGNGGVKLHGAHLLRGEYKAVQHGHGDVDRHGHFGPLREKCASAARAATAARRCRADRRP